MVSLAQVQLPGWYLGRQGEGRSLDGAESDGRHVMDDGFSLHYILEYLAQPGGLLARALKEGK
jgi:hypothetical protein